MDITCIPQVHSLESSLDRIGTPAYHGLQPYPLDCSSEAPDADTPDADTPDADKASPGGEGFEAGSRLWGILPKREEQGRRG